MTLDEWISLSAAERNVFRRSWERSSGAWTDLLHEAHSRFQEQFGSHPLINYITHSAWQSSGYEPAILVTTALYTPQLIEELPDRFCTFQVRQDQVLDNRDHYLRYWALIFLELLNWSEAETREWARKWEDDLNGRNGSMFYHEDPYYYALPVVISKSGISVTPEDRIRLQHDVHFAIRLRGSEPLWLSPYDWDAARARVNAVLKASGGQLPRRT